jgi:hypothetical protein
MGSLPARYLPTHGALQISVSRYARHIFLPDQKVANITVSLAFLPKKEVLKLKSTSLTGTIPTEIGLLTNLSTYK